MVAKSGWNFYTTTYIIPIQMWYFDYSANKYGHFPWVK